MDRYFKWFLFSISLIFILLIIFYIVWLKLPFEITRRGDIEHGELVITNLEKYLVLNNRLPNNDEWEILEELGYKVFWEAITPEYWKLSDTEFEIIFVEGFDGPYLMWNSKERLWKMGYHTFFKNKSAEVTP